MEAKTFSKSWFSSIVYYSILAWTAICFAGTWFVIIKYGILRGGLAAIVMTFFFGTIVWAIPSVGLILLSLYVTPSEENPPSVRFVELIKRGMKRGMV